MIVQLTPNGNVQGIGSPDDFFKQKRDFGKIDELTNIETIDVTERVRSETSVSSNFPLFDAVEHVQEIVADEQMAQGTVKQDIYWFYLVRIVLHLLMLTCLF